MLSFISKLLLSSALYSWSAHAKKDPQISNKMQTAWKAFLLRIFTIIEEHLPQGACPIDADITTLRNQLKDYYSKGEDDKKLTEVPEMWVDR